MRATLLVGLTGGIGSGKSTVAQTLAALGAVVIDADAIARSVTAPGGVAIAAIASQFGPAVITPDRALDRDRMRRVVFENPDARRQLEAIIHPLVAQETWREAHQAIDAGSGCVVFDVPLLVETGRWRQQVDRVLVVDCSVETQIQRVMARNGLARAEVEKIIGSQASRAERLAAADIVIHNEGLTLDELRAETRQAARSFGL